MGKKLLMSVILLVALFAMASAEKVDLGTTSQYVDVTVNESNDYRTVINYEVGAFDKEAVDINGQIYNKIKCGDEANLLIKGAPSLPRICRSIIIPDDAKMEVKVLSAEYVEFDNLPVVPSKGILLRTVNPEEIPYTFGAIYENDTWFPSEMASLREPFILRDYRGSVVDIYPFQYNPAKKTLRVYTSIEIVITNAGPGEVNLLNRQKETINLVRDFETIYQRRFINYDYYRGKYPSVPEVGDLLIITYDSFHDAVMPLVEWKLQKGMKTTIVDVSTIGNNQTSIKNYIQNLYNTTNLAFVLLVGDYIQVTPYMSAGDACDPIYAKMTPDNYPDIFIGRFSAENLSQVETQVERSVNYEKTPYGADWFHKGTGIASNQGPGHNGGEYDNVHMGKIRDSLLSYNYTYVDQIYDPSGTSSQVSAALNEGRSIINYCGHGSTTAWSTTGFSNSNVNALVNNNMLPFIISVACVNGDFDGPTCFGEAWLRATNGGVPTGAIAAYMSSINQSWDPPMDAQDEAVHLLINEYKLTIGGLCFNGSCRMIEINGSGGVDMYDTWHIFGDPSIMVRTLDPAAMTVSHDAALIFTLPTMDVQVPGIEGALCALYHNSTLFGSAYTDAAGNATITIEGDLPIGEAVTLTVSAYNYSPYIGAVQIIAPEGPFIVYDDNVVDDILGNNDGVVNCGESISLTLSLTNVGPDTAYSVSAVLSTSDEYITITDDTETYGAIPGDFGTVEIIDAFAFDVSENMPNDHFIEFNLAITGSDIRDTTWYTTFTIEGHCYPAMSATPGEFADSLSLDDMTVDSITIYNDGHAALELEFSSYDGWLDFASGVQTVAAHGSIIFEVAVSSYNMAYGDHYGTLNYTSNDPLSSSGSFMFSLHVYAPDIDVSETDISQTVETNQVETHPFIIFNNGPGNLEYGITRLMFNGKNSAPVAKETVNEPIGYRLADPEKSETGELEPYYAAQTRGMGGPDLWGYNWVDSDEPDGPTFEWVDITAVGVAIDSIGDDDTTTAIPIGFSFPFYENYYSELYIGSNGIITFGSPSRVRTNTALPYTLVPNNLIAMWWDDLDPRKGGQIYYYSDVANERFIVSFEGIPNYYSTTGTGSLTFQAILYANGKIKLQYGVMDPGDDYNGLAGATIGIENSNGEDGLQVVYDAEYVHSDLAIMFTAASWLSVEPGSGTIIPFSSDTVMVGFDAAELVDGEYNGELIINSNDPDTPELNINVLMTVTSQPQLPGPPVLLAPNDEATDVSQPVTLDWNDMSGCDMYQLQVDTDPAFTDVRMDSSMAESQCDVDGLDQGVTYYWRVRAHNTVGWGEWSVVRSFTTEITWICGDFDNNELVNILDITAMIGYLYNDGDPPAYPDAMDVNNDGALNILDVTKIIAFLYQDGPPLECP